MADCFTLIVSLLSCGGLLFMSLPIDAVGWPAVCDCGIFWSYSLTHLHTNRNGTWNRSDLIWRP